MDTSRIGKGEWVAAVAGAALFLILFLPWYGIKATVGGRTATGPNATAWEAFGFIDILLLFVVLVAVGLALLRAAGSVPATPVPPGVIVHLAGAVAVVAILYRLIDPPGDGGALAGVELDVTRKIGAFLGLVAAVAISAGGRMAIDQPRRGPRATRA
jgi:hypothetical protein